MEKLLQNKIAFHQAGRTVCDDSYMLFTTQFKMII